MGSRAASSPHVITVGDLHVEVVRKRVKNVNLKVYPPDGLVRVSAPLRMPERLVVDAVKERLDWIEHHRRRFATVMRPPELSLVSGEALEVLGERRTLRFDYRPGLAAIGQDAAMTTTPAAAQPVDTHARHLAIATRPSAGAAARRAALEKALRALAKREFQAEVERWAPRMGVETPEVVVRRMTSRWGTCHVTAGKVLLNLALVTRPRGCLTYVVVHELAHLLVPDHSQRFWATVERHLPDWRAAKRALADRPLWADPVWGRVDEGS